MTFQLDTSGAVAMGSEHGPQYAGVSLVWSDLSPFAQGYIEALFAASVDPRGRMMMPRDGRYASAPRGRRKVGFSDLAPETLARIIADCDGPRIHQSDDNERAAGRNLWERRQSGNSPFPPLTVQLGDDGKVRFA